MKKNSDKYKFYTLSLQENKNSSQNFNSENPSSQQQLIQNNKIPY